jgi:phospholipid/cholesterol/gamma-HCH transport system permease protein
MATITASAPTSPSPAESATARPSLPVRAVGWIGRLLTDDVLVRLGRLSLMVSRTISGLFRRSVRLSDVIYQIQSVGVRSLGLVATMAAFAGMVLAFQFGYGLERFGAKLYIGQTTVTALVRELGPVMTALVAGGRIGAGIAAELGGMAVTEQIDAVRALGADPLQRLVAPRLIAVTLAMPLLAVCADVIGTGGGLIVAWGQYGVPPRLFLNGVFDFVTISDFGSGLFKSLVFGFIIGAISTAEGMRAKGGTEGVGRATTRAVVAGALVVLGADFLLTKVMLTL